MIWTNDVQDENITTIAASIVLSMSVSLYFEQQELQALRKLDVPGGHPVLDVILQRSICSTTITMCVVAVVVNLRESKVKAETKMSYCYS